VLVFSGVSFALAPGGLLAVTGANGTGKSSLLRILAGLLRPDAGTVHQPGGASGLHFLGHLDGLKAAFTLREMLRFWSDLLGAAEGPDAKLALAAEEVSLSHALDLPSGVLSAGQRRRAGLARLLLARRPLWLLDEPGSALDRDGEALLGRLLGRHLAEGGIAVAATHQALPVAPSAVLDLANPA
jgi:heme exporter protein A